MANQSRISTSSRYYFKEVCALGDGQVCISPMDLNIEQQKIEYPLTPVIRYATPIVDSAGETWLILVLNVFGSSFLRILAEQQDGLHHGEKYFLCKKLTTCNNGQTNNSQLYRIGNKAQGGKKKYRTSGIRLDVTMFMIDFSGRNGV